MIEQGKVGHSPSSMVLVLQVRRLERDWITWIKWVTGWAARGIACFGQDGGLVSAMRGDAAAATAGLLLLLSSEVVWLSSGVADGRTAGGAGTLGLQMPNENWRQGSPDAKFREAYD
ncbi:hypothetical protein B0T13DRAFT_444860 [Neurospora crassa]|nr:hypothetical protein B0T13DRAFT_444860 [Neurospora crassa]